jgi:hypothetical protein
VVYSPSDHQRLFGERDSTLTQHTGTVLRPPAGDAAALLDSLKRFIDHDNHARVVPDYHIITDAERESAYATCEAMHRHHSKGFYLSTALLPPAKRRRSARPRCVLPYQR